MSEQQPPEMLARSPTHLLHLAERCADALFMRHCLGQDITARQFAILAVLAEEEGINQMAIMERTGIDRSTTSGTIMRLKKRGWVRRKRSRKDLRSFTVQLTDRGWQAVVAAREGASKAEAELMALIPEEGRETFLTTLRTLIARTTESLPPRRARRE